MRTSPTFLKGVIFILKAVGQSIKAWILTHKKLYFFIIGFIAFVSFMVITLIGFGKVSKAETDYGELCIPVSDGYYTVSREDYPYYVVFTDYLFDSEQFVALLTDEPMTYGNGFSDTDLLSGGVRTLYIRREKNAEGDYVVVEEAIASNISIRYLPTDASNVYSNYDVKRGAYEVVFSENPLAKPIIFNMDAPYFKYKMVTGSTGSLPDDKHGTPLSFFKDFAKSSTWAYMGVLENMSADAERYATMLEFTVTLPTFEWLDVAVGDGHPISYYEFDTIHILSNIDNALLSWNSMVKSSDKQTYTFSYPLVIEPVNDEGTFYFQLTYEELLTYVKYCNPDAKELFSQYSYGHQCLMSMFMKIESISGSVVTSYPSVELTGRRTYNEWGSLTYDSCLEVILDMDENADGYKEAFDDVYEEKYDEFVGGLYDEIAGLEEELERYKDIQSSFGNLSGSDVWSTFSSLVSGLTSFASSVKGVAVLTGSVLAFFPIQISSIISFTLVSLCIIAIIKAIRG